MSAWEKLEDKWDDMFFCEHKKKDNHLCGKSCSHVIAYEEWNFATDDNAPILPNCLCETHYAEYGKKVNP